MRYIPSLCKARAITAYLASCTVLQWRDHPTESLGSLCRWPRQRLEGLSSVHRGPPADKRVAFTLYQSVVLGSHVEEMGHTSSTRMCAGGCVGAAEVRKFVTKIRFFSRVELDKASATISVPTSRNPSSRTMGFDSATYTAQQTTLGDRWTSACLHHRLLRTKRCAVSTRFKSDEMTWSEARVRDLAAHQ